MATEEYGHDLREAEAECRRQRHDIERIRDITAIVDNPTVAWSQTALLAALKRIRGIVDAEHR